jgi:hypothetical protein
MSCGNPTLPCEPPFWQDLARCDYFSESQENVEPDIYIAAGSIWTINQGQFK